MYSYKGDSEVLYYVAFWLGSFARKQIHASLIIFSKNTYFYFSKFKYILLVDFPSEVRHNWHHVSSSHIPGFSGKTEPRLKCHSLGCEYEKKNNCIAHFYQEN